MGPRLRTAATVLTNDPLFGWLAYGERWRKTGAGYRSFRGTACAKGFGPSSRTAGLRVELDRDGFAAEVPIVADPRFARFRMTVENRTGDAHLARLKIAPAGSAGYSVLWDGKKIGAVAAGTETTFEIAVAKPATTLEIVRR